MTFSLKKILPVVVAASALLAGCGDKPKTAAADAPPAAAPAATAPQLPEAPAVTQTPSAPPAQKAATKSGKTTKEAKDEPKVVEAVDHVARRRHHHVQHYSTPAEYKETRALNLKQLQGSK